MIETANNSCAFKYDRGGYFILVMLLVTLMLYAYDVRPPFEQMDDAYISFQYAKNLVAGNGLVFNIGDRVEGYTNLLWTLLVAAGMKIGFSAANTGYFLSVLAGGLHLLATAIFSVRLLPLGYKWLAGFSPLILLSTNSFSCWTASGLETGLFSFFVVMASAASIKEYQKTVLLYCVMATLTRPEGAIYSAVIIGLPWVVDCLAKRKLSQIFKARNSLYIIGYFLFILVYTAWRMSYYGEWLPNTYYAKTGGIPLDRGFVYIWNFILDGPGLMLPFVVIAALKFVQYRIAFVCILLTLAYVVFVGGDAFRLARFILPVLPLVIAGALASMVYLFSVGRAAGIFASLILLFVVLWNLWGPLIGDDYLGSRKLPFPELSKRTSAQNHAAFGGVRAAKKIINSLSTVSPPVTRVATIAIGQLAFFSSSDLELVDLVGLVDKYIARSDKTVDKVLFILPGHQKTDSDYVLDRNPQAIIIPKKGADLPINLPAVYDLWHNPRLEQRYYWEEKAQMYLLKTYSIR